MVNGDDSHKGVPSIEEEVTLSEEGQRIVSEYLETERQGEVLEQEIKNYYAPRFDDLFAVGNLNGAYELFARMPFSQSKFKIVEILREKGFDSKNPPQVKWSPQQGIGSASFKVA